MGLLELFTAVLIVGLSGLNAALPLAAWSRTRDGRFLLVAGSSTLLATLGAVWTWGELPVGAPSYTGADLPVLLLALAAVALLFGASVWPRAS